MSNEFEGIFSSEPENIKRIKNFIANVEVLEDFEEKHKNRWNVMGQALLLDVLSYITPDDFKIAIARLENAEKEAKKTQG